MSLFFWSDTHFNHDGIRRHCPKTRAYSDVIAMNMALIHLWNLKVSDKDTIYLLGDFAFKHPAGMPLEVIFGQLNGHKHLIVGNHDERNPAVMKLGWEGIDHLKMVSWEGRKAAVCHYPLETWASAHHGVLHFHGHSHGTLRRHIPHRFDVGVDVFTEGPVSWDELWFLAAQQSYDPQDHHGSDL